MMELSMADLRDLLGTPSPATGDHLDPQPGDKVFIRTITMHHTGVVVACSPTWIMLDQAAWIPDSGRFGTALTTGQVNEVEPMGDGVLVARSAIIDIAPWGHDLPLSQK